MTRLTRQTAVLLSPPTRTLAQVVSAPGYISTVDDTEAAPLAASSSAVVDIRVPVQNLGLKPNVLPPVVAYFSRKDLAKESAVSLKRWAKMFMVPSHKKPSEILDHIFSGGREVVPAYLRRRRSLRTAAVERGIVRRHDIDYGRPRTMLKSVKNYNPHKPAIVEKAREELGPQSPVPTDVGSPPPEIPTSPMYPSRSHPASPTQGSSASGPSCIDKGKGVDRGGYGPEEEIESPFLRPSRVPLGQMSKDDLRRRTGVDVSPSDSAEQEHPDGSEHGVEYAGEEQEAEDAEEYEDPARGRDTGTLYIFPPENPQKPRWLEDMRLALEQDGLSLQATLSGVRGGVDKVSSEVLIAEAEMEEECAEYTKFVEVIRRLAGPDVVKRIIETASQIEVPEFEIDEYMEDEEAYDYMEQYEEPGDQQMEVGDDPQTAAQALFDQVVSELGTAENRRPSDVVSYLDPSSPPPTSPLARAEGRAKRRRDNTEDRDEGASNCSKRRRSANSPSHRSQPPSCAGSPKVALDRPRSGSPRLPLQGLWDGRTDPEPSSPAAQPAVQDSNHGNHDDAHSPRDTGHNGSERGCSRSRSGSGSPQAEGAGSNLGSRAGSASYVPSEGGSRSLSRSPPASRADSAPGSGSNPSTPESRRRHPCKCEKCIRDKVNPWDSCDSWTDLVSPEMSLPPGWPDKMDPQYDYLKDTPLWKEAMAELEEQRRREAMANIEEERRKQAEAEKEEMERTQAEIAEAAAALKAAEEAEAEEAGQAQNKGKGKGRAPAKRKAPAKGKAKGKGKGKTKAPPQVEEEASELAQIGGSSSGAQAEEDGDDAERMDVDAEAVKVADAYEADSERVDQGAVHVEDRPKKGKAKANVKGKTAGKGRGKKTAAQSEEAANSNPMQVDGDAMPSASTARMAPPPKTPVRRSTRRRGATAGLFAATPAMELPSRTLDGRTIRRGNNGMPPMDYGPPRSPCIS
ncbi:hypothetical protein GY45DRAFT_607888 [Cubamyces sp. BRFM 1775]|nr:hypothetical protein GY45DRAFT_607888 [Cubamyces sp. BRFM 1775]